MDAQMNPTNKTHGTAVVIGKWPYSYQLFTERLAGMGLKIQQLETLVQGHENPLIGLVPIDKDTVVDQLSKDITEAHARWPQIEFIALHSGVARRLVNATLQVGASGLFQIPLEEELLVNKIYECCTLPGEVKNLTYDQLMRVNIGELELSKALPFDVFIYLPMNKKIIHYIEKNRGLDEKTIRKFKENPHFSLYIRRQDIRSYRRYCKDVVNASTGAPTAEERAREKAKKVSSFMGVFFSDDNLSQDEGDTLLDGLKNLLRDLEDESGSKKDLIKATAHLSAQQMTHMSHAENVAAYASAFGLAAGIHEPESLRMGGMLHDLGLSDLPTSLIGRDLSDMSEEDAAKYQLHPGNAKYTLEKGNLKLPQLVMDMVLYHHERPDGSGYPYGKKSSEIPLAAKICAFADEFDKLTSVRPGHRQLTPADALRRIAGLDGKPPLSLYEPEVHKVILDTYFHPASKPAPSPVERQRTAAGLGPTIKLSELAKTERLREAEAKTIPPSPEIGSVISDLENQIKEHWKDLTSSTRKSDTSDE